MSHENDNKTESNSSASGASNSPLGKLLEFRPVAKQSAKSNQKAHPDAASIKLMKISDEIDALILHHVNTGDIDLKDLAGLLSHRLGTLMSHIENKKELLPICLNVLKKQAKVD
ncbi:MAG: hypothetical protein NT027_20815 [Proteobacteria bacterium]|nr:hypothetical protein [Pseudomonadota bacterium]